MINTLFLPVYWDRSFSGRVGTSIALAKRFEAHLVCAIHEPADYASLLRLIIPEGSEDDLAMASDLEGYLHERLVGSGISWSFVRLKAFNLTALARAAQLSDLAILPANWSLSVPETPRPSDLMVRISAPTLAIPDSVQNVPERPRVMVAWDGSMGAAAAVRAAVPLLRHAEAVAVVTVGEESDLDIRLAEYLGWQGIAASSACVPQVQSVSDTLLAEIGARGTDLLVMGAYGSSKWLEDLFGGVTVSMLRHCPVPILLAN